MKPGARDHRHRLLISGDELRELQQFTDYMSEAFGLDRKIEKYRGTRPITLYRWDLDCLRDVIALALRDKKMYPNRSDRGCQALKSLGERLRREYDSACGKDPPSLATKEKKVRGQTKKKTASSEPATKLEPIYQFKITLLETHPPIWRRIQVSDCTLDKLHEHIQTVMGWTNSHLHDFRLGEQRYGDPVLLQENFEDMEYVDSTATTLSDILPKTGKQLRFEYQYDFGDSWDHEVLFEGCVKAGPSPVCIGGARACPPEDVGGTPTYPLFLEAMADPDHERHDDYFNWIGGEFDPEAFDPVAATIRMHRGLPDWRSERQA
jgi:hypothetical protein